MHNGNEVFMSLIYNEIVLVAWFEISHLFCINPNEFNLQFYKIHNIMLSENFL